MVASVYLNIIFENTGDQQVNIKLLLQFGIEVPYLFSNAKKKKNKEDFFEKATLTLLFIGNHDYYLYFECLFYLRFS